ncbi:hypothetical protein [Oerskovia sp. KBS0722]|uniref:hypothetical protein n=1 Tax=Oerskovia sp. KBS0722 TaxID=1179673 RepID=UPI001AEF40B4|nr:hypothetical protein [Oerskovia sp. KBS0722]
MTPEVPAPAPGGSPGEGIQGPDGGADVGREGAPGGGGPDGGAGVGREGVPGVGGPGGGADVGRDGAPRRPRTERKQVLLRLDPAVHDALARWASDELRSVNAQIDMVLRRALDAEGRLPRDVRPPRRPGRPPAQ